MIIHYYGDKISLLIEIIKPLVNNSEPELLQCIHQRLIKSIGLTCHQIIFVPFQTLPRTPSGKQMRNLAIESFISDASVTKRFVIN